ncbi:LPS-assembly protein LptD, partial [Thiohalocapsa sp.]|uniref:LPS-assembly protein LptD n=1 Tax=Thiohalocapsa sp. TaxID=2497641 RepID=UPI0025EA42AC
SYRRSEDVVDAVGGVTVVRDEQRVEADQLRYDRSRQTVPSPDDTYLEYPQLRLVGAGADVNLDTQQGRIDAPRFRLSGPLNVRGRADTAYVVSPTRTAYRDILYTSCPPGSNAWSLRASQLKLDQEAGVGVARDARVRIRGMPLLYTPYLRFPIDDRRRSGFLVPSVGSSQDNGFELRTPYYWNIAPNMDATLTPRLMTERGIMLGSEFRWLTRSDAGEIRAELLPDDRAYEGDERVRWGLNALEEGRWLGRLVTRLDFNAVSDDQYLEDLGNNIDVTSTRRLRQRGDVTYYGRGWSLLTRLEGFQTIDQGIAPEGRPYGRLPQILFRINPTELLPEPVAGLTARPNVSLEAEYDFFDHNHRVHGQRFTLTPALSWPLQRSYGHLIPGARLYLSTYALTDTEPGFPDDPGHAIPSLDLDGKLIFERETDWLGETAVQTLEPRLYYLYTPYEAQAETPVFDSSELDFSFANLFRSNRFTGRDRIGDTNQVTAGISSRMLRASTGEELFRLSLGQIYYFADRRVQISGPPQTDDTSPYTGELSARLFEHWFGRASFQWDPDADQNDSLPRRTLRLEYRDPEQRMLNLAYRTDLTPAEENRYEDTDVSFRLPFGTQAELVGRWLYSMRHDETMDAFAGVEFGKCCWRLRLLGRHFKRRPEDAASTSVMLQVELAGLGAIGDPIGDFLEREIYGYSID